MAMEMVEAPVQAPNLRIAYAKTAKRVDVKKLKSSLWHHLSSSSASSSLDGGKGKGVEKSFQQTINELPQSIPPKELSDVSVPYCFICLLHLANEKGFEILPSEQGNDLIVQLPSS